VSGGCRASHARPVAFGWIVADNPRSAQREKDGRRIVAASDFQYAQALTSLRSSNCPVFFIRLKPCGQILVAFFSVSRNVPPRNDLRAIICDELPCSSRLISQACSG
jgi:hypothetical protein